MLSTTAGRAAGPQAGSAPIAATSDPPLTVELLADLQAGLLDDATAARIRSRVRSDPQAQQILRALNRHARWQ